MVEFSKAANTIFRLTNEELTSNLLKIFIRWNRTGFKKMAVIEKKTADGETSTSNKLFFNVTRYSILVTFCILFIVFDIKQQSHEQPLFLTSADAMPGKCWLAVQKCVCCDLWCECCSRLLRVVSVCPYVELAYEGGCALPLFWDDECFMEINNLFRF